MNTIDGIPSHPLFVHFVVVAVPLTALAAIVVVLWPRARTHLGIGPAVLALITLIAIPITTSAGGSLKHKLPRSSSIAKHAHLGDQVILAVGPLFGLVALWWLLFSPLVLDRVPVPAGVLRGVRAVAGVATIVAAVIAVIVVVRAGDTGAHAVWSNGS